MEMQSYKPTMQPASSFLLLMGLWLVCFVAGGLLVVPVWYALTGESIFEMQKGMMNPKNIDAMKIAQLVSTFFMFFLPAYITARIVSEKPLNYLGYRGGLKLNRIAVAILLMLAVLPFVAWLADVNKAIPVSAAMKKVFENFESQYEEQIKLLAQFRSPLDYISALLIIALMPAIVEETFFRGALQNILKKWIVNPHIAIFTTSVIFSVIHFSYYGFLPRIALGMMLGYIFYVTGNLWYSIIGHFFNNALMVTILYVQYLKDKTIDTKVGESAPWWAAFISLVLIITLFIQLKRMVATKVHADSIAEHAAEQDRSHQA